MTLSLGEIMQWMHVNLAGSVNVSLLLLRVQWLSYNSTYSLKVILMHIHQNRLDNLMSLNGLNRHVCMFINPTALKHIKAFEEFP